MHITLRFFGTTAGAELASLRSLVRELAHGTASSAVRASTVTGFPTPRRARVLVLGIADDGTLAALAARAESRAVALGFAAETRAFQAHLTLARMRKPVDVTPLAGEAAALPAGRATAIALYESTAGATGPVYVPLERVTLGEPGA